MYYRELPLLFKVQLASLYDEHEAVSLYYYYMYHRFHFEKHTLILQKNESVPSSIIDNITLTINELQKGLPIQYWIGEADFLQNVFQVNSKVLIPRPETEELVQWILDRECSKKPKTIMDIGTGSGVIAISLKLGLSDSELYAIDYSEEILKIAQQNAVRLNSAVQFIQQDIFANLSSSIPEQIDVLVSNPPYIPQSEYKNLHINVSHHEPTAALFVPDSDPLCFYRRIAEIGRERLTKGGRIYFETYHLYHDLMKEMLTELGYSEIEFRSDINGKARFITAKIK